MDLGCITTIDDSKSLAAILQGIINETCSGKLKVGPEDSCLSFLSAILTSEDGSINYSVGISPSGCQTLDLSVNTETINDTIVKFSDFTQQSSNQPNTQLRNYSVVAGTLVNNGDSLIITTQGSQSPFPMNYNELDININGDIFNAMTRYGAYQVVYTLRLTRISNTQLYISGNQSFVPNLGIGTFFPIGQFSSGTYDLDNLPFDISIITGVTNANIIISNYLIIDKFKA